MANRSHILNQLQEISSGYLAFYLRKVLMLHPIPWSISDICLVLRKGEVLKKKKKLWFANLYLDDTEEFFSFFLFSFYGYTC